jgi:hypothetical protein
MIANNNHLQETQRTYKRNMSTRFATISIVYEK